MLKLEPHQVVLSKHDHRRVNRGHIQDITKLECTVEDVCCTRKLAVLGFDDVAQLSVKRRMDLAVGAEDASSLVEGPGSAHLLVVSFADSAIDRALHTLSSLGDKINDTTDWLDDSAEQTFA